MAAPGGLTTSIRRKLQDGKTPEEVIQELVAGGLSELSAQRFVDRAIAEDASAPPLSPLPPPPQPVDSIDDFLAQKKAVTQQTTGQKQLIAGSLLIMGGMAVTFISYMMADPGEGYTLMWGPIVVGALLLLQSLNKATDNLRTYPWLAFAGAVGAPIALAALMFVVLMFTAPTPEEVLTMQLAKVANADKTPAGAAPGAADASAPATAEDAAIARAIDRLSQAKSPVGQCDAATTLAKVARESVSEDAYEVMAQAFGDTTSDSVKICMIGAIVELGHEDAGLDVYGEWSRGTNTDLRRAAVSGFGDLGPDYGQPGLPFLGEQLKSPDWGMRFLAVTSLAKLGPSAESLLQSASTDADARVRESAQAALKNTR